MTPTTFPKPPQGEGLLVFPYTAAALGVPGGGAVPNALWDEAPINFFNDFGGCAGGKTSDCYRWERYSSPLAAGETSAARTSGSTSTRPRSRSPSHPRGRRRQRCRAEDRVLTPVEARLRNGRVDK